MINGSHMHRRASFPTIDMCVDAICDFAWTFRYAAAGSVFPIKMRFCGNLICMDDVMWSIQSRKKPYNRD